MPEEWVALLSWWAGSVLVATPPALLAPWACGRLGLVAPNYRGEAIPTCTGLGLMCAAGALVWVAAALRLPQAALSPIQAACLAVGAFGALGLADDLWGEGGTRGFGGHLAALLMRGRLTTGLLKAVGGVIAGIGLGFVVTESVWDGVVGGLLIAVCANLVNQLDTGPGRAIMCWSVLWVLAMVAAVASSVDLPMVGWATLPFAWAAACLAGPDGRGEAMLGDCGANILGALLGLTFACMVPLAAQVPLVALVLAVSLWADRNSLSDVIERHPTLRRLDRLGTTREGARDSSSDAADD